MNKDLDELLAELGRLLTHTASSSASNDGCFVSALQDYLAVLKHVGRELQVFGKRTSDEEFQGRVPYFRSLLDLAGRLSQPYANPRFGIIYDFDAEFPHVLVTPSSKTTCGYTPEDKYRMSVIDVSLRFHGEDPDPIPRIAAGESNVEFRFLDDREVFRDLVCDVSLVQYGNGHLRGVGTIELVGKLSDRIPDTHGNPVEHPAG